MKIKIYPKEPVYAKTCKTCGQLHWAIMPICPVIHRAELSQLISLPNNYQSNGFTKLGRARNLIHQLGGLGAVW